VLYPFLPPNTSQSWKVKTSNKLEKPRYALIRLLTDRKRGIVHVNDRVDGIARYAGFAG